MTLEALRSCLPSATAVRPTAIGADVERRKSLRGTGIAVIDIGLGPKGPSYISSSLDPDPAWPSGPSERRT